MSAHTDGPWALDAYTDGSFTVRVGGMVICARNQIVEGASESIANAYLIATAPELLATMQGYVLALDQWENSNKAERRVKTAEAAMRAAIAKATGSA